MRCIGGMGMTNPAGSGNAPGAGEQQPAPSGNRRDVRFYWATAGATAVLAAIVTGVFALLAGSNAPGPAAPGPSASSTDAPSSGGRQTTGPSPSPSPSPSGTQHDDPAPPVSYERLYARQEVEIPERMCPKKLEIDLDAPQPEVSRGQLAGADGYLCEEAVMKFTPFEARDVQVARAEEGMTAAQCRQALDDETLVYPMALGVRPFCVLTTEGHVVYVEGNVYGSVLVASAWRPSGDR